MHVARALEHGTREVEEEYQGKGEGVDEEVERCIGGNVVASAQPEGEGMVDGYACETHEEAEDASADERMLEYLSRLREVVGTNEMSHLNAESH